MAQRNLSLDDLEYVIAHGKRINRTGIAVYMLRKRDIPYPDRNKSEISRLEGTVVLAGFTQHRDLEIITTYRNRNAFKTLRSRAKYDARKKNRIDHRPQVEE